jgi:hypothetical protein
MTLPTHLFANIRDDLNEERHYVVLSDEGWLVVHPLLERYTVGDDGQPLLHTCRFNWRGGDPKVRGMFWLIDERTLGEPKDS